MSDAKKIEKGYQAAKEQYAEIGVDADKAMEALKKIPISLHCWQADDVGGFETEAGGAGGGCMATGGYPGKARNVKEHRSDLEKVYSLLPGKHRLALHASYLEAGGKNIDRDQVAPEHFTGWVNWAKQQQIGLDFNQTFFSHPKADSGFTLASYDEGIRNFWIDHAIACRKIGEYMGKEQGTPCILNLWIPDGYKDIPVDRYKSRAILKESLDKIFAEKFDRNYLLDSVESKLFGIGAESCTIGSHEFYLGYAIKNNILVCLDAGHYHPTEVISDKISSVMLYLDEMLLHVSRPVRWDSDHVVILTDEIKNIAAEVVRNNLLNRVHIGLDFFDASINRIAAYVIGTRCMIKALLIALLEPTDTLRKFEVQADYTSRLAILEELKTMPFGAVWDYYCLSSDTPVGKEWLDEVKQYEKDVLSKRG